jgi:L-glyceraldehyde 3-phosphate reductase
MLNRWVENGLLDTLGDLGIGCIAFSPLAQGMLSDKYLNGIPEGSRVTRSNSLSRRFLSDNNIERINGLNEIARNRGQTLAQMAIAWVLRDERVTSALIGARTVEQLEDSLGALRKLDFTDDELRAIDQLAMDGGIDIWSQSVRSATPAPVPHIEFAER